MQSFWSYLLHLSLFLAKSWHRDGENEEIMTQKSLDEIERIAQEQDDMQTLKLVHVIRIQQDLLRYYLEGSVSEASKSSSASSSSSIERTR